MTGLHLCPCSVCAKLFYAPVREMLTEQICRKKMVRDASVNAVSEGRNGLDGFCSSEGETTNCDTLGLDDGVATQTGISHVSPSFLSVCTPVEVEQS